MSVNESAGKNRAGQRSVALAIGPAKGMKTRRLGVSGQMMMFQHVVETLKELGVEVVVFDISEAETALGRYRVSRLAARILDYLKLVPQIWWAAWRRREAIGYLTIAPTPLGFCRDFAVLWPLLLMRRRVHCHRFGGNYGSFYEDAPALLKKLIRYILGRVHSIIVEGSAIVEEFAFLPGYKEKVRVVPNTLPDPTVRPGTSPKTLQEDACLNLLYLSSMIESKGYLDVLEAVRLLANEECKEVRCVFAGRFLGPPYSSLEPQQAKRAFLNIIRERSLAERVDYFEGLFGQDKLVAYEEAHVFLLPSSYPVEGQPTAMLEAMACGCVLIGTDYRLIPSMLEDGYNGFFVSHHDPDDIASKLNYLVEHPNELSRMSSNSMKRFEERFSPAAFASNLSESLALAVGHPLTSDLRL